MSFKDFKRLLNKITELPVRSLDIIGGEPTLHSDILRFVRAASRRGLRVNISSNGTNITALSKIQALDDLCNNTCIGISINDIGIFKHVKEYVQQYKPVVKMVYNKCVDTNLITDILLLRPKKFYLLYCDIMVLDELQTAIPFYQFLSAVNQWQAKDSQVGAVFCSGFLPETYSYPELAKVRCAAGTTKLGIFPDGSVYPCNLFFGRKDYLLGNVLEDPFDSIWNHPMLGYFRTFISNTCPKKKCILHTQCHGGCPAHSLFHTGDITALDPRCA